MDDVSDESCVDAAARFIATQPDAVRRALDTHYPNERGVCAGCGANVVWPCIVAFSARRAEQLLAGPRPIRKESGRRPGVTQRYRPAR